MLGNRFLISKYTQALLSNVFPNKHVPTATNPHATIEEEASGGIALYLNWARDFVCADHCGRAV
jgi:hypothetical protein